MESYLEQSRDLARRWDAARPRTKQQAIGWSGMADCRAYLGYKLAGTWPTDEPDKGRAIFGTALHSWWTHLRRKECHDRGIPAAFGVPVSYGGITGTLDEVLWPAEPGGRFEVTDYKMPKLSSVRLWDDDDFLNELFVQPHGYAAGILEPAAQEYAAKVLAERGEPPVPWTGHDLDPDACIVRLLGMPVNGNMSDWAAYERPFTRAGARRRPAPPASRSARPRPKGTSCRRTSPPCSACTWCEFATACRGGEEPRELELITDPQLAAAVDAYGLAGELIAANEKIQAEDRGTSSTNARGRTEGGFKIWRGRGNPAKIEFDDAAVEAALGARGIPLSDVQRLGPAGKPKLYVKRA